MCRREGKAQAVRRLSRRGFSNVDSIRSFVSFIYVLIVQQMRLQMAFVVDASGLPTVRGANCPSNDGRVRWVLRASASE